MYIVIKDFVDLHDNDYQYHVGEEFPRDGIDVAESRIEELASEDNKQKTPLIAEVVEEEPVKIFEEEPEPEEKPKRRKKKEE